MRPYAPRNRREPKGQAGCRKSEASLRRDRLLRIDKKAARREGKDDIKEILSEEAESDALLTSELNDLLDSLEDDDDVL